ncbi:Lin0512 family protein [Pseudomonas saliphila]|uniref:Lin0512 family protein n=1 Tax=Pseudomonas saliphila TaxID=2586906 RepID=UPI0012398A86|nr:Lin0512 family protein [Pseudomonas saliphila]
MAKTRVVHQFGMGTSIRSRDYTEACARGIRDALWHNSVNVAGAFGFPREAMLIDVEIGVQKPEQVNTEVLLGIFPYGKPSITVTRGGLDISKPDGSSTSVIANVAIIVSFDMEPRDD